MKKNSFFVVVLSSLFLSSCGENINSHSQGGAIILGDSSTIVTETDPSFLEEVVADLKEPVPETGLAPEPAASKPIDTPQTTVAALPREQGFLLDFGTANALFVDIATKEYTPQNPQTSDGLSYAITEGNLNKSKLQVNGVKEVKVRQRYQTALEISGRKGKVELIGYYTSTWEELKGQQTDGVHSYSLPGLNKPDFISWSASKLRSEAERALKKERTSSANMRIWRQDLKKVRSINAAPCKIVLKNVQYQISGTDAKGKAFFKTIRLEP